MNTRRLLRPGLLLVLGCYGGAGLSAAEPKAKTIDYVRDVKPILANNCFACHGPDEKTRKAKLRIDLPDVATKPARSGETPVVPGKSAESELVRRIFSADEAAVMPPADFHKKLTPAEKDLLKRWVDEGAEYRQHWSFVAPKRPTVPPTRHPVDHFAHARLAKEGLKPAKEADRATLVRRLSFDLRGLPPTLREVEEFVNDAAPDAYERLVDRMLASPHYGEKMTVLWLDLARFGDTSGYHYDSTRQMWLWRDWVVKAYNDNKPFDQFTIEQLAGDLLPNPTLDQKIASGFNRNTRFNEEGGADPEEFVVRYNVDRTNTLGQVWLGLTLGCAECHSHKYDPVTQKEYYQLFAFFTGIKEPQTSGNHGQALPPLIKVPTPEQERAVARTKANLDALQHRIAAGLKTVRYQEPPAGPVKPPEPKDIVWIEDAVPPGAQPQGDGPTPWRWGTAKEQPVLSGEKATRRSGAGLNQHYFTGANPPLEVKSKDDRLFAYVYLDPKDPPKSVMLQFNDGSWEHRAYWGEDVCFLAGSPDGPNHRKAGSLPKTGEWARLEVVPEQVGLKPGGKINGWAFTQFGGTVSYDKAGLRGTPPDERPLRSLAAWAESAKGDAKLPGDVAAALKAEPAKRTDAQQAAVRDHYLRFVYAGTRDAFDPLNKEFDELTKTLKDLDEAVPSTLVSEEMPQRRPAHVLIRGDFQQRGERVEPGVPAALPPLPTGAPANRLGLAKWLVSPDHPLTARVVVNRLWAQMFGAGLVRSAGDFGTQGEYPSHPELLDWLATEYVRLGWDTKAMLKLMATSATYRQSSEFGPDVPEVDPNNRLLYRAPRFRLTAEEVRDNALAVSGLLTRKLGGPSVMPYQPPDFYKGKNEGWKWEPAAGEDLYRRGLYTFWRRTSLHPMFAVFDAPSREECTALRPRTNTPLQALVTLNDPTFVEASRVFAQRVLREGPKDLDGRLSWAFRTALARTPGEAEARALAKRYAVLLDRYQKDPKAASEVVKAGQAPPAAGVDAAEHAAWTGLANILLNLDETVTRE